MDDKFVVSGNYGIFDVQLVGDYLGKRYATFTNDLSVPGYFTMAGRIAAKVPLSDNSFVKNAVVSLNVTNINDKKAASTLSIAQPTGTFNEFPLPPRQFFGTVSFSF